MWGISVIIVNWAWVQAFYHGYPFHGTHYISHCTIYPFTCKIHVNLCFYWNSSHRKLTLFYRSDSNTNILEDTNDRLFRYLWDFKCFWYFIYEWGLMYLYVLTFLNWFFFLIYRNGIFPESPRGQPVGEDKVHISCISSFNIHIHLWDIYWYFCLRVRFSRS